MIVGLKKAGLSKKMKCINLAALGFILLLQGCVIIRGKADSFVEYYAQGHTQTLGLKEAYWRETTEGVELIAFGWHYREHETYAFFINEPSPAPDTRWIYLKEKNDRYYVEFYHNDQIHTGQTEKLRHEKGKIYLNLSDVSWNSNLSEKIEGSIIAVHDEADEFERLEQLIGRTVEAPTGV